MLAAARQGSNRAWAALLERVDPHGRALAHLVLGGHDVDAVLLVAYIRAYRARRKGGDDAVVVLLNHVWTACGHEIRRRQRREDPAPGRRATRADLAPRIGDDALAAAVGRLRPEERAVWALVERRELPAPVVAAALGVSERVVTAVAQRVADQVAEALLIAAEPATASVPDEVAAPDGAAPEDAADHDDDPGTLDPPPASPGFWAELGRRLKAERDALPAAPPPTLPEPGAPSPALTPAKAPPVAMQKRAPRRARRDRPDLVENLAEEADRQRGRRPWPAVLLRVAAVLVPLALVAGAVAVLYMKASNAKSPVRGRTTASIAGGALDRLAAAESWSATVTRTGRGEDGTETEATYRVVAAEDGSFRIQDRSIERLVTYDARFAALRDTIPGFPARQEVGVAPGPPDPSAPRAGLPLDELAMAARALSTETDTEPTEGTVGGVDTWTLRGSLEGDLDVTFTVSADDLTPVRLVWADAEGTVADLRFSDVVLGVPGASFTQELPAGTPSVDRGFTPVELGEVQSRIDLAPLTPDYLPTGFVISGTAVDEQNRVVSLRYSRGPAQVIVTLRPSPVEAGQPWADPFDRAGETVEPEAVTMGSGPFRDVEAQVVSGAAALPSVWGADGELAFTVAGDLSPDDLLRVARSLG